MKLGALGDVHGDFASVRAIMARHPDVGWWVTVGDLAGDKFCAWKRCSERTDCGPKEDFCCVLAPSPETGQELKLCDFKEGKCP